MSIKINDKIIAGNQPRAYRYVGEIFQSILPINDIKVAPLDGRKLYSTNGYKEFINYLATFTETYPQLFCTETIWQETIEQYGECGKFVLDDGAVRLPKITGILQGVTNISELANLIEAGLPNITGNTGYGLQSDITTGPFQSSFGTGDTCKFNGRENTAMQGFDLSVANPIYKDDVDTVQPQTIQYPYYIVLATGIIQEVNIEESLETNVPFTLLEAKYSEITLDNTSWLLSNGQWNTKQMYPDAYNKLVEEYNKENSEFSIKLNTSTDIADYDFVINTTDEIFKLPIKTKYSFIKENAGVKGNDKAVGLTDGTNEYVLVNDNGNYGLGASQYASYPVNAGTTGGTWQNLLGKTIGLNTMSSKSGVIVDTNTSELKLYFYVGNVNKNTALINVGEITESLSNKLDTNSVKAYVTETFQDGTSWYRVYSDGWCEQGGVKRQNLTNGALATIKLLKQYQDTNYNISVIPYQLSGKWGYCFISYNSVTINSFKVAGGGNSTSDGISRIYWQTCGYII